MDPVVYFIIMFIVLGIIAVFLVKYLGGDFSYKDEIISTTPYTRSVEYANGATRKYDYTEILIKRTYHSGRIEIIKKRV
jgi:uncharacterized membrane protein YwaF